MEDGIEAQGVEQPSPLSSTAASKPDVRLLALHEAVDQPVSTASVSSSSPSHSHASPKRVTVPQSSMDRTMSPNTDNEALEDTPRRREGTDASSPRSCSCSGRYHSGHSARSGPLSARRGRTEESDDAFLDSVYDDDFLDGRPYRPCWRTLHAVFILTYAGRGNKVRSNGKFNPLAGHADNFRTEDGYVLKALTMNEASVLETLSREAILRPFAPQFMGCVEREGRTFIKMQDVLLSMSEPNFMDVKMGLRTFAESEVGSDKRRPDLLKKALAIQQKTPSVYITDDEKENGITKHRFMALRDHASSSATLGFRVQGVMKDQKALTSKDFSSYRSVVVIRALFRSFFERASPEQRAGLLQRMKDLHAAASNSEWFARHEIIGSSLLIGYDTRNPAKFGIWMIDFARTEPTTHRLTHTRAWQMGNREDGYLLGIQSLIKIWSDELTGDIPLNIPDWHYRAEGHDSIVIGYHGTEPTLQGKVLRLAKESSTLRHRNTVTGHPATAYNDFVSTMLRGYLGHAADPGQVVYVSKSFLEAIATAVEPLRPEHRAQHSRLDLGSEYQLLLDDAASVRGAARPETIAVELKLKMGYTPPPSRTTHWVKSLVSRFAMHQQQKLAQDVTGKVSDYCPIDLFSGDFDRIQNVVLRLLDTPQNNIRVFLGDSVVVPQKEGRASSLESCRKVLDACLGPLLGKDDVASPSRYLSDLVAKCLLQPSAPGGVPLMKKVQNLQRLGLDIETLWPYVKHSVQEMMQIYHLDPLDVGAVAESLPAMPPLYCHSKRQRERRGLRVPTLAHLHPLYAAARAERAEEIRALEARLGEVDNILETRKFLLSQSLKASALMVALTPVPNSEEAESAPDTIRGLDGCLWRYSLRLLDLDAKNMDDLERWFEQDCSVVRTYLKEVFDVDWEPAAQPPGERVVASLPPIDLGLRLDLPGGLDPLDPYEVDRILGLLSPRHPVSAGFTETLEAQADLLRQGPNLPPLTDRQIDELLGLIPPNPPPRA